MFVSTQERRIKTTGTPGTSLKYHCVNNGCDSISETIFFSCGVMCFDVYQSQGQRGSATWRRGRFSEVFRRFVSSNDD